MDMAAFGARVVDLVVAAAVAVAVGCEAYLESGGRDGGSSIM